MAKKNQKDSKKKATKKSKKKNKVSKKSKPKKKSSKEQIKWIALIIGTILALGGTTLLAKYVLWPQFKKYKDQKQVEKKVKEQKEDKLGPIYTIGDLTVNPFGSNGLRFVIAEVALEATSEESLAEIEKREPQIKDLLIRYFRQRSTKQILNPAFQDSSTIKLRKEINKRLYKGTIDSLYFLKLVVQ
ncbi:MAG: flagellar basal body-associated FliL family protein [Candidatus Marinimicrobia bacterium]|nr:flagellar basal body-associated FliL family protein [Candidatus Neomarinimicrobiota bacterium]